MALNCQEISQKKNQPQFKKLHKPRSIFFWKIKVKKHHDRIPLIKRNRLIAKLNFFFCKIHLSHLKQRD